MCLLDYKYWTFHFALKKKEEKKETKKKKKKKNPAETNRKVYNYDVKRNKAPLMQKASVCSRLWLIFGQDPIFCKKGIGSS